MEQVRKVVIFLEQAHSFRDKPGHKKYLLLVLLLNFIITSFLLLLFLLLLLLSLSLCFYY